MKRFFVAALSLIVVVAVVLAVGVKSEASAASQDYSQSEQYEFLQDFATQCRDRYGYEGELNAANYLKEKFDLLLQGKGSAEVDKASVNADSGSEKLCNVVAKLDVAGTDKQIVIGSHFDAVGQGANDNATGVTALYFIMKNLVQNISKLPCDVIFVAFGGEERGLLGSNHFVSEMSAADRQNTLLMVNIDSICNGDNLYLFCENKKTSVANLFLQNDLTGTISEKPYAQGTYALDLYGYGYYEAIQASDYTPFRLAEIPSAMFFSGNFVGWDYVESTDSNKNTMNTNSDTLQNLTDNGADLGRIEAVVSTVCNTVLHQDFATVAENARAQLINNGVVFNIWWPRLVAFAILVVMAILVFFYYRKLQKRAIMGTAEIKNDRVFGKPNADDIFSFDGNETGKKDDIDDIFTFKK